MWHWLLIAVLGVGFWLFAAASRHMPVGTGMIEWRSGDLMLLICWTLAWMAGAISTRI